MMQTAADRKQAAQKIADSLSRVGINVHEPKMLGKYWHGHVTTGQAERARELLQAAGFKVRVMEPERRVEYENHVPRVVTARLAHIAAWPR